MQKIGKELPQLNNDAFLQIVPLVLTDISTAPLGKQFFLEAYAIFRVFAENRGIDHKLMISMISLAGKFSFPSPEIQIQLSYILGEIFYDIKDYYRAQLHYQKVINDDGHSFSPDACVSSILNARNCLAYIELAKGNVEGAVQMFKETTQLAQKHNNLAWVGITNGNLAAALFKSKLYKQAIPYLRIDIFYSKKFNQIGSLVNAEISLADAFVKLNQLDSAKIYIDTCIKHIAKTVKEKTTHVQQQVELYTIMANYYYQLKQYDSASKYFATAQKHKEILADMLKVDEVETLLNAIEINKANAEITLLNEHLIRSKKQNAVYAIVIFMFFALFVGIYWLLRQKHTINKKLIESNTTILQQKMHLEQINANKDKLFSIIGHDLKGAAIAINGFLEGVYASDITLEEFKDYLPALLKTSNNFQTTLENLLAWSFAQFKGIEYKGEYLDIKLAIDKTISLLNNQASVKNIKVVNDTTSQMVFADGNLLQIVIRNLLNNAIKFSHQNTTVTIKGMIEDSLYVLTVKDEGIGMTDEQINHIINAENLQSSIGTSGEKGVGLGLQLVKEFIEKNGGQLQIHRNTDKGTSFIFGVPITDKG